ncbi:diguanylate cyclase [Chromobacterium subtsugae]|uniref:Diguanylate cyclase n=1 Tax=Chromobacterium subtsugae TaxID=251747 RepID=A0ABS7FIC3_9NEIS|nr:MULTISPECIES: diguanylate cyclase [Chromobacterium]KUM04698.1 diguanylate cyclase [Chromobacterium subtsugae]KZE84673.1 diguanylate cyclase [Chromobacterium sp. F49]MBW7567504.1 GGDEF domain-containing protein [Chromobacterium subtsugae]MBW8289830.1 diguanylate cyclase [Chromobacterium subtsugae]WSE90307.1 diguanylate cyclase [Chromobacterium subtsugae]
MAERKSRQGGPSQYILYSKGLRYLFDSIVTRLLALALLIVLTGSISRYYALSSFLYEDLSKVVENQQLTLANYVAHDINGKVEQREDLLIHLATVLPPELLKRPPQLRDWLKEHYQYQPLFSIGLFVVRPDGRAIADYPLNPRRMTVNYRDRDYIRAALQGDPYIGRAVVGLTSKIPVLPMGAPIYGADRKVKAVLVGVTALDAPNFLDLLQHTHIGGHIDSFLLVSPRDKQFVSSSQPDMILKPLPRPGVNRLHDKAMAGFRGAGITVNAKGVEEVSAIASVPRAGWFVVARLPSSEAFATVERVKGFTLRNTVAALVVFALICGGGLYIVLRPLFQAARHADRMTRGELPLEPMPIQRNDEVGHLIAAFNRVLHKLNDQKAELARIAHHDSLTGLPNRSLLSDRLHMALAQAQRKRSAVALLFMDLDGFKLINDTLGHKAGDKVLWQVAQRLSNIVRQTDTLARIGGDEFVLLLSDLDDGAEGIANTVAQKCIEAFDAPFQTAGASCKLGISIGIALGDGLSTSDSLLQAADQAMYLVKKTGRSGSETIRI